MKLDAVITLRISYLIFKNSLKTNPYSHPSDISKHSDCISGEFEARKSKKKRKIKAKQKRLQHVNKQAALRDLTKQTVCCGHMQPVLQAEYVPGSEEKAFTALPVM